MLSIRLPNTETINSSYGKNIPALILITSTFLKRFTNVRIIKK